MSISFLEEASTRRGRDLVKGCVFITFSPSWDEIHYTSDLRRYEFTLAQGIRRDMVRCGRKGMEIREPGGCSDCILSQEAERSTLRLSRPPSYSVWTQPMVCPVRVAISLLS